MLPFDDETAKILERYGFDRVPFFDLRRELSLRGFDPDAYRLPGPLEPARDDEIDRFPAPGTAAREEVEALGRAAIGAGQVGVVVLNGGMATRFGGGVKGLYPVHRGRCFLDLKIAQIAASAAGRAPLLLMNSFATDSATRAHLERVRGGAAARQFSQYVSVRLTPEGEVFPGADGRPSLHAPGHGDLPFALASSGELERFVDGGGRWLTVSNVDNLGARLDPAVIGAHIARGRPVTVELVEARAGDVGGFPARIRGRLAIVEGFRLPEGSETAPRTRVFNTNSFVFDAPPLAALPALDWYAVAKTVDGRRAIQFERLLGQVTERLDTHWLLVPRGGPEGRFVPIKTPSDLAANSAELEAVLARDGLLE